MSGQAAAIFVVLFVFSSTLGFPVILMCVMALVGLTGRSRERRQLAAVACASLICTIVFAAAALFGLVAMFSTMNRSLTSMDVLVPLGVAVLLAVLGPLAAAFVGRRLWRWALAVEPSGPGRPS